MNVMAKAHKLTREFFNRVPSSKMSYRGIFKESLVMAHKEHKAAKPFAKEIARSEAFIKELKATPIEGYMIVIGEDPIPCNAEAGHATNTIKAPIYYNKADAEYYARKVRNGSGEVGRVVLRADQLKYEIAEQESLVKTLKSMQ